MIRAILGHGRWIQVLLCFATCVGLTAGTSPQVPENGWVAVIRHGEKDKPLGHHINAVGWQRAAYLIRVFGRGPSQRYVTPKAIFANLYGPSMASVELAKPIAKAFGLDVITSYSLGDNKAAADAMIAELQRTGGPILVVWEHRNIVNLVTGFGCWREWMKDLAGEGWPQDDYDHIFNLTFTPDGACVDAKLESEGFVTPSWTSHDQSVLSEARPSELRSEVASLITMLVVCGMLWWCLPLDALFLFRWRHKATLQMPLLLDQSSGDVAAS